MVVPEDGIPGSLMIMPLAHRETLAELTADEVADTLRSTEIALKEWCGRGRSMRGRHQRQEVGANLIWNLGRAAGQTVPHLHAHFVRRDGTDLLPGFGARWWLKNDLRAAWLLKVVARLNPQDRWRR